MGSEQPTVEYREIPGWPGYRVGNDGSVWTCWSKGPRPRLTDRWTQMKASVQKRRSPGRAYHYLNLRRPEGKRYRTFRVHRLILEAFVGPCPDGMESRHLDLDPSNNRLGNLAWDTPEQNRDDNREADRYSDNKRSRRFTHDGKTLCLKDWAKTLGVPYLTLYQRVTTLGMTFEEAISRPFLGVAGNGGKKKPSGG